MRSTANNLIPKLQSGYHLVLVKDGKACAVPVTQQEAQIIIKSVLGASE